MNQSSENHTLAELHMSMFNTSINEKGGIGFPIDVQLKGKGEHLAILISQAMKDQPGFDEVVFEAVNLYNQK